MNDLLIKPLEAVTPDTDTRASISARPGGSAANAAAWMAHHGLAVTFVARVGTADRTHHEAELARLGVDARLAVDPTAATGTGVVLIASDGGRTMFVDRGANLKLSPEDVPAQLLDGVDALHLTGYSFCEPAVRGVVLGLLRHARDRDIPFTIDPSSSAFLEPLARGSFLAWTRGAAVCFPNLDEAAVLTGGLTPDAMAATLVEHYGTVVLKLGGAGVLVVDRGERRTRLPAVPGEVHDTTGAGDAFCGGFLSRWLSDGDAVAAARIGLRAAASAVAAVGGRP